MPTASEPRIHAVDALQRALRVAPVMTSEGPQWRQVTVCLWRSPWIRAYDLAATDEVIVALHTGGSKSVRAKVGGGWTAGGSNPGHVHVIPAGFATGYRPEGELEFVSVHIGAERVRKLAKADGGDESHVSFRFAFHDAFIGSCVQALREEMEAPREHGSLYVDSVTDALTIHLLRSSAPHAISGRGRESLSPRALSRVCERIEESLEHGLSLADLAGEAGTSRFHFARAFRSATGVPPHRYMTLRRIERAKELLVQTDLPLVDVALASGFGSQSHFTLRFRETVGLTPRRFRETR